MRDRSALFICRYRALTSLCVPFSQDDKPEEKGDKVAEDAEMKVDEPAAASGTDASGGAKKEGKTARKQPEPTSSRLENLSRVVPAQLQYISFPTESRYTPIRPVNSGSTTASSASVALSRLSSPVGTGGGILLMRDAKPEEEQDLLELEVLKAIDVSGVGTSGAAAAAAGTGTGPDAGSQSDNDLLTAPIADTPAPFEWSDWGA